MTDEVESEFDVEFEFEREGTRSVCRLLLDREADAVEADEKMEEVRLRCGYHSVTDRERDRKPERELENASETSSHYAIE